MAFLVSLGVRGLSRELALAVRRSSKHFSEMQGMVGDVYRTKLSEVGK